MTAVPKATSSAVVGQTAAYPSKAMRCVSFGTYPIFSLDGRIQGQNASILPSRQNKREICISTHISCSYAPFCSLPTPARQVVVSRGLPCLCALQPLHLRPPHHHPGLRFSRLRTSQTIRVVSPAAAAAAVRNRGLRPTLASAPVLLPSSAAPGRRVYNHHRHCCRQP